jgi:choline dehydrogenase-like flavoprotein
VSGDAAAEPWRPPGDPYPMPPLRVPPHGEILAKGFRKLGLRVAPAPLAINSAVYRGRAACQHDGWCDAGCPIGALANPLVLHHPQALRHGAVVLAHHAVTRVLMSSAARASGVEVTGPQGRVTVRATLVVLAAGAIQNARLLLNSPSTGHTAGLGNNGGLVGRHFHCHSVVTTYGLFDQETQPHLGVNAGALISQDGYAKDRAGKPFGSYQWGLGQAVKPNDLLGIANTRPDLYGAPLHAFMRDASRHIAMMSAICETFPAGENRIELADARDDHGLPLVRVVHTLSPEALTLREFVDREGLEIMRAAGSRAAWSGRVATTHALGGTVMGASPRVSVTDTYGRLHETDNVYVAGGGLFPSAGAGGPTFTLYALADRTADHLLRHWDRQLKSA